ncbi:perilipin-1-like [Centruroides sculpturatus]|uniref:perilipin-1-like n=1 Tax=Centruroides sculpturatus TaxID=218467 RepID=UPI000C6DD067|nr:perilipin-1-like [Centruroides sculpturatus]
MEGEQKKINVFSRLMDFPVFATCFNWIKGKYEESKNSKAFGEFIVRMEKVIVETSERIKPVLQKMDTQISALDELAVKGLNKLEEYCPITKKQPAEIKDAIVTYVDELKRSGKLNAYWTVFHTTCKEGINIIQELLNSFFKGKMAMSIITSVVDFLLPPLKDEAKIEPTSTFEDLKTVMSKCVNRLRFYGKAMISKDTELCWTDFPLLTTLPAMLWGIPVVLYYEMIMAFLVSIK